MLITPLQLENESLPIAEQFMPGTIDFSAEIAQIGPLPVDGQADLIVEHRGGTETIADIRVRASYRGTFEMECARCVEPVQTPVEARFDLIFRPQSADADAGERSITADETEIGYYEEDGLRLEDVVREQVLLTLPARVLCQPDCKGLCPRCGQDLNLGTCSCETHSADPRWNALAGLADKLVLRP